MMSGSSWRLAALVALTGLLALSFVAAGSAAATDLLSLDRLEIRLQRAVFDPLAETPALPASLVLSQVPPAARSYYLVQFRGPIQPEWRAELERAGATVVDYVPQFAYVVGMDGAAAARVEALEAVRWVGLYHPAFRLSTELDAVIEAGGLQPVQVVVRSFPGEPVEALVLALEAAGATPRAVGRDSGGGAILHVEVLPTNIQAVAHLGSVAWVEPRAEPELYNEITRSALIFGQEQVEANLGLYGAGQVVVVGDTGVSTGNVTTMHADFQGHFYQGSWGPGTCGSWSDYYGHGTHVAGSVLGNGIRDGAVPASHAYAGTNAGIAPEAQLWAWAFCSDWSGLPEVDPYNDYYGEMYDDSPLVRINTNSWGYDASPGTYNSFSRETDRFIWDHQDMAVFYAASNDGVDNNGDGIVDLDSMGIPAGAKNIVTVGASENYRLTGGYNPGGPCSSWGSCWPGDYPANPVRDDLLSDDVSGMVAFSSRGPVDDGRLKPDIVAPGSNVVSTRHQAGSADPLWGVYNTYYSYCGGTSMSTPLAAGAGAIVREFYDVTYGLNPSAALVKATLINGAHDMTPGQYRDEVPDGSKDDVIRRPDNNQGWGRIDLATSLIYTLPHTLWFEDDVDGLLTGEEYVTRFTITGNQHPLRVTLAWSDYPGTEASHGALVNDLDLEIVGPGGAVYYGNDVIGDGLLDGDVDHANNVEGIDLWPVPGSYTVYVKGYNVPQGPQRFALVASGDMGAVGHLSGTVYDGTLGGGLEMAAVVAISGTAEFGTETGASGTYSMPLAADTYSVSAWKYGYTLETISSVQVISGGVTLQDFTLNQTLPYSLTGCVADSVTGEPLAADVTVYGPFGDLLDKTSAPQATGCYTFTLPGGPYTVRAEARLHRADTVGLNLTADTVQDFDLVATTTDGILWGQVTNLISGSPVEGATVEAAPWGTPGSYFAQSSADGGYELLLPPGPYTVTVSAPLYSTVEEAGVVVPQSNLLRRDYALPTAHMVLIPPAGLAVTLDAGQEVTRTLVISNSGQGSLDFEISERDAGFQPAAPSEDVLLVNRSSGSAATAFGNALAALGYTYLEVTDTAFRGMPVADLLSYDLIIWAGSTGLSGATNDNEIALMAYLDAGGSLLHADNDLGYYRHGSIYYDQYLHAIYGEDDATDTDSSPQLVEGQELMAGLVVDLTTEPYPDGVLPRDGAATAIFEALGPANPAYPYVGLAVEGTGYQVVYLAFDFDYVGSAGTQAELVQRAYDWLAAGDLPWLETGVVSGTVPPGEEIPVMVTFRPDLMAEPGTYDARLRFRTNDPAAQPWVDYPLEMYVLPPPPVLSIAKTASAGRAEIGMPLVYTLTVSNAGGTATGGVVSDTVPAGTLFAWASPGGNLVAGAVAWDAQLLPAATTLTYTYGVTVSCVASGTQILNDDYQVYASEWPTRTIGAPVAVTAVAHGARAAFEYSPVPVLLNQEVEFENVSANALLYAWDLGDGTKTNDQHPRHTYTGAPGQYTVVLTASNACTRDVATELISVENYAVAVDPTAATLHAESGTTVTFTLWVTNEGTLPDTFELTPAGAAWPTALSTTSLALDAGESQTVTVAVSVPGSAPGNFEEAFVLRIRSLSDPRLPAAATQADLAVIVQPKYSVELGPPTGSHWALPGGTVTYTLQVTNTSNVVDTISLARRDVGWPMAFSWTSKTIAAGGHRKLEVYVTVPPEATAGQQDVAVIRATGSAGHAEAVLTTGVMSGKRYLYLPLILYNTIAD